MTTTKEFNLTILNTPITNVEMAKAFILHLRENNAVFHWDDDASEIINGWTNERLFTDEQAVIINQRVEEAYGMDWSNDGGCIFGYTLDLDRDEDENE